MLSAKSLKFNFKQTKIIADHLNDVLFILPILKLQPEWWPQGLKFRDLQIGSCPKTNTHTIF